MNKFKCSVSSIGIFILLIGCFCFESVQANSAHSGTYWRRQIIHSCRLTAYQKGRIAKDKYSKNNQSVEGVKLVYSTFANVGTASAPSWVPMWSFVKVKVDGGVLLAVVVDRGSGVESMKASAYKKRSKKGKSIVIDLCALSQWWKDFLDVELFCYDGPLDLNGKPLNVKIEKLFTRSYVEKITQQ